MLLEMTTGEVTPVLEHGLRMGRRSYEEDWRADTGCCAVADSEVD